MGAAPPPRSAFGRRFGQMAERQAGTVTLPRGSVVGAAVGASLLAVWAGVATWCVLQSDVLSASFLARHTAAERVYEDRIGALRARLDQVTSQKLVEQEGQESRFAQIAERQRQLENRHLSLARLLGEAGAPGSGRAPKSPDPAGSFEPALVPDERPNPRGKPAPLTEVLELRTGAGTAPAADAPPPPPARHSGLPREERLSRIEASLRTLESAQLHTLHSIRRDSESQVSRLRTVIASLGLAADRLEEPAGRGGIGGPYVPLPPQRHPSPFDAAAADAENSVKELARLRHASAALPSAGRRAGRPT